MLIISISVHWQSENGWSAIQLKQPDKNEGKNTNNQMEEMKEGKGQQIKMNGILFGALAWCAHRMKVRWFPFSFAPLYHSIDMDETLDFWCTLNFKWKIMSGLDFVRELKSSKIVVLEFYIYIFFSTPWPFLSHSIFSHPLVLTYVTRGTPGWIHNFPRVGSKHEQNNSWHKPPKTVYPKCW